MSQYDEQVFRHRQCGTAVSPVMRVVVTRPDEARWPLNMEMALPFCPTCHALVTFTAIDLYDGPSEPAAPERRESAPPAHIENAASRGSDVKVGCSVTREPQTVGHAADDGGSVGPRSAATDKLPLPSAERPQPHQVRDQVRALRDVEVKRWNEADEADRNPYDCGRIDAFHEVLELLEAPRETPPPFTPEQVQNAIRRCESDSWEKHDKRETRGPEFDELAAMLKDYRARLLAERREPR